MSRTVNRLTCLVKLTALVRRHDCVYTDHISLSLESSDARPDTTTHVHTLLNTRQTLQSNRAACCVARATVYTMHRKHVTVAAGFLLQSAVVAIAIILSVSQFRSQTLAS